MRTGYEFPGSLNLSLLLLLGLLWGMPYALTRISLTTMPPLTLVAARSALAAAALWIVVGIVKRKRPLRLNCIPRLFIQGCVGCFIPYALIAFGQQTVDSSLAAILNSMTPLFVCLIGVCTRPERLTAGRWLGTTAGLVGVMMIAGVGALGGIGQSMIGQLAILLATLSSAVSVIHGRKLNGMAPEIAAAGTLTSAAVMLVPLCFMLERPLQVTPSLPSLAALLANAILTTALGFVVYFRLIRTVGSVRTASVGYLKPVVGVLIGCMLLGDTFTWTIAAGLIAILIGVAAINHADTGWAFPRRPARPGSEALTGRA